LKPNYEKVIAPDKPGPLDEPAFEACHEALGAAVATVRQWGSRADPKLKAKLALLIIKDAENGETNSARLRTRALATYFLDAACEDSKP
jgi:hypothetical protein